MDKTEIVDRLNRTSQMEETMVATLVDLCHPDALSMELSPGVREKIRGILLGIKEDSVRHEKMVAEIRDAIA